MPSAPAAGAHPHLSHDPLTEHDSHFFETAAMLITFVSLGKLVEAPSPMKLPPSSTRSELVKV
jgi:cation transport ATPase